MTEQAISPLRRRMIEDMTIRKFAQKTQHDYVQRVKDFANYLKRSPDTAKPEDVRGFQLHLTSSGAGTPKINATVAALRFFFRVTLDRSDLGRHLSTIQQPLKLPFVLSPDEVACFLEAAPGIKYKAAFSVAYGAGLRVSEVATLKVTDINSKRMMLRIEQGKGRKDRYAMLSPTLLELLRDWYRIARGHAKLETTALYTHVAAKTIREVMSPLDRLTPLRPKKDEETKLDTNNATRVAPPT